jgi:type II secretory pathway pseudopilin PulG
MCDAVSLAVIGGVASAAGSLYGGMQQGAAYDDQARFAERQAMLEGQAGAYEAERLRTQSTRALAGMRQQYVSSGIDPNSGSAREVIEDSAREAALDAESVNFGASLRAGNRRFEAHTARANAQSARIGGVLGAVGNIIGGATNAFDFNSRRTVLAKPYGEP